MAYGVTSQKFLCCLPVRIGVFILSFLQLLTSGAISGLMWYVIFAKKVNLETKEKISAIAVASVFSIVCISSLLGFLGSIVRSRRFVSIYSTLLNWLLAFTIGAGIVYIVFLFTMSKQKFINQCVNGSTEQDVIDACNHVNEVRFITLGWLIAQWLVHIYICIIASRYIRQLDEEDYEKYRLQSMKGYQRAANRDSMEALAHPAPATYPYADGQHSFGAKSSV